MTNLGTLGGTTSLARSINNLGQIIGETSHTDNIERQFIYQNGTVTITGTSGSTNLYRNGESYAINDSGHVVGYLDDIRGFLYQNGTKTDLPHLGGHSSLSFPYDINNIGQVVGVSVNRQRLLACLFVSEWRNDRAQPRVQQR
jgi:probable HAF family extracellular repeat protein